MKNQNFHTYVWRFPAGTTIDDAAGEAFDKVAKLLGLDYPGGPMIQQLAAGKETGFVNFPVAKCKNEYDFSFSGVKTSVLRYVQKEYGSADNINHEELTLIAASFQHSVVHALTRNVRKALKNFDVKSLSLVGGVAANQALRNELANIAAEYRKKLVIPSLEFCGDNAAMIAYRASKLHEAGIKYSIEYNAFPSLNDNTLIKDFVP